MNKREEINKTEIQNSLQSRKREVFEIFKDKLQTPIGQRTDSDACQLRTSREERREKQRILSQR